MTFSEFIEYLATLSAVVLGIVEGIKYGFFKAWFKRLIDKQGWEKDYATDLYTACLVVISVVIGIFVALGAGEKANLLSQLGFHQVSPLVGIVITGVLLGFGDKVLHELLDGLGGIVTAIKVYKDKLGADLYE
jgi:NhaP-type Na+/H+ or K+/H+ antiporter